MIVGGSGATVVQILHHREVILTGVEIFHSRHGSGKFPGSIGRAHGGGYFPPPLKLAN
jgi:hypothetical protein